MRYIKEEAQILPTNTVPGISPRGAKPAGQNAEASQLIANYDHDWIFDNEISELGYVFFRVQNKRIEDFLIPQHSAIFSVLHLFGQYTESIHRQAVTPFIAPTFPSNSSSQLYDMLSPKKAKARSPNISIGVSLMNEDNKDNTLWINGINCRDFMYKERLRKKSDIFMFRLSRRLF